MKLVIRIAPLIRQATFALINAVQNS
jgi:hypothetical protein